MDALIRPIIALHGVSNGILAKGIGDLTEQDAEEYCENCGRPMVLKRGRFGQFMACTGYPDCKTTRRLDQGKRVLT